MRSRLRAMPLTYPSRAPAIRLCAWLALAVLLTGCGGSSSGVISAIVVSPPASFITLNGQETLIATAQDSKGKTINGITFTWTSSAPDVVSVDSSGVATGHTAGTAEITASASGITSGAASVTVVNSTTPVASVSLTPISATINVGQTQQFTATAKDVNGNTLTDVTFTWHNSSAGVAIVSTNGMATGTAPGTTVITASVGAVTSPAATLTVTAP